MPISAIIEGHGRKTLFSGVAASVSGSTGLGTFDTTKYSRFTGLFSVVGSITLRWRLGIQSGTYVVTSSTIINSGSAVFETTNFGKYSEWTFLAANSQNPRLHRAGRAAAEIIYG